MVINDYNKPQCECRPPLSKPYDMKEWTQHELLHYIDRMFDSHESLRTKLKQQSNKSIWQIFKERYLK